MLEVLNWKVQMYRRVYKNPLIAQLSLWENNIFKECEEITVDPAEDNVQKKI